MPNITHSSTTDNGAKRVVFDADDCRRALSILPEPGAVFEIRVLHTQRGTLSGYFNDLDAAVQAAETVSGQAPGVYLTVNPVNPDLLARAVNRLQPYAKTTTADSDILRRRWLPIDLDPIRPAGISSTDDEHEAALERAREVRDWLVARDWPEPILADSGNGAHLLCRVDLPKDDDSRGLIERSLKALALQFDDERVQVDVSTANAARIWKIYGTLAGKGDNTSDRPHRLARLLEIPEKLEVLT